MKTRSWVATAALATAGLCYGKSAAAQNLRVAVCMQEAPAVQMGVRPLVATMFARIGVGIDWRSPDSCPAGVGAIQVSFLYDSSGVRDSGAEALAFARPFARTIVVFLDRIPAAQRKNLLLAHVLVHEITHVLQGINRHSVAGIMKARWNDKDFIEMRQKPLAFAPEDTVLIYAGMKMDVQPELAHQ